MPDQTTCERTWIASLVHRDDTEARYRQHRCSRDDNHPGHCRCRYCGSAR